MFIKKVSTGRTHVLTITNRLSVLIQISLYTYTRHEARSTIDRRRFVEMIR